MNRAGSFVWSRDPEEAYSNPYEYDAQRQFAGEARRVLTRLEELVNPRRLRFRVDDHSLEKALWMIRTDVIDSLQEALTLLDEQRHRPAARLFRDAVECADLALALATDTAFAEHWLPRWYLNESPPHRAVREALAAKKGSTAAANRAAHFRQLSKFAHRTYRALLKSYSVGRDELLVHDRWSPNNLLVLPGTIAGYYAILADLICMVVSQWTETSVLTVEAAAELWASCLESESAQRRFAPVSARRP